MKASNFIGGDYLKSEHIGETRPVVTVARYTIEKGQDQSGHRWERPCLWFQGKERGLLMNATNLNACVAAWGDEMDAWIGRQLTLYVDPNVQYQGKTVPGLRVLPSAGNVPAAAPAPQPSPSSGPASSAQPDFDDDIPF